MAARVQCKQIKSSILTDVTQAVNLMARWHCKRLNKEGSSVRSYKYE
jgi:hypothetical protein